MATYPNTVHFTGLNRPVQLEVTKRMPLRPQVHGWWVSAAQLAKAK